MFSVRRVRRDRLTWAEAKTCLSCTLDFEPRDAHAAMRPIHWVFDGRRPGSQAHTESRCGLAA